MAGGYDSPKLPPTTLKEMREAAVKKAFENREFEQLTPEEQEASLAGPGRVEMGEQVEPVGFKERPYNPFSYDERPAYLDFTPAGPAFDVMDYEEAKDRGDKWGMAAAGVGTVPIVGDVVKRGVKALRSGASKRALARQSDEKIEQAALSEPGSLEKELQEKRALDSARDIYLKKRTLAPKFKKWFGESQVKDVETGEPLQVYHGSGRAGFESFKEGGPENHAGRGIYFSDSPRDAGVNYASKEGADITAKVNVAWDGYAIHYQGGAEADELIKAARDFVKEDADVLKAYLGPETEHMLYGIIEGRTRADETLVGIDYRRLKLARILDTHDDLVKDGFDPYEAEEMLVDMLRTEFSNVMGHAQAVKDTFGKKGARWNMIPAYLKMEKPLYLTKRGSPKGETIFSHAEGGDELLEALEEVSYRYDLHEKQQAPGFGNDLQYLYSKIAEGLDDPDGLSGLELWEELVGVRREQGPVVEIWDEYGNVHMNNQFAQDVFRELGHDGIVADAHHFFGTKTVKSPGGYGIQMKGMPGITPETHHYIVFEPTQAKSPMNRGTFDPIDPRMLYGVPLVGALANREKKEETQ